MKTLIAGNWKMHMLRCEGEQMVRALAAELTAMPAVASPPEVLVCPPFTLLHPLHAVLQSLDGVSIALGGQDCHGQPQGAHTGDISAPMLKDGGASFVILGHSERRAAYGEGTLEAKIRAAYQAGLRPIVCVGETLDDKHNAATLKVITDQLADIPALETGVAVAYEPCWAIGTGLTPTPEDVQQVHQAIRTSLEAHHGSIATDIPLLYGGSVNAENAAAFLAQPDVNGALIGGASLQAETFAAIVRSAANLV